MTAAGFACVSMASGYLLVKSDFGNWKEFTLKTFDTSSNVFPTDTEHVHKNVRITPKAGLTPGSLASERLIAFTRNKAKFNFDGVCQVMRCGNRFFHSNRVPNPFLASAVLAFATIGSAGGALMFFFDISRAQHYKDRCKAALYN